MSVGELSCYVYAVTKIHRKIQEENIFISCQALMYAGRGVDAVHFLPESQYPGRYR